MIATVALQVTEALLPLLRGMIEHLRLVGVQKAVVRVVVTVMGGMWVPWVVGTLERGPTGCLAMFF